MEKVITSKLYQLDAVFFKAVKDEANQLIARLNWNGSTQIMLQTLDPAVEDWSTGTGKLKYLKEQDERKYQHIQPSLRGGAIDKLLSNTPLPVFRTRLMKVESKRCYSLHNDLTCRLHLALTTNESAMFLFPTQEKFYHIPVDRYVHLVDTREIHSFVNCGDEDRVHIVMCVGGS